jgi:hypothetical protein
MTPSYALLLQHDTFVICTMPPQSIYKKIDSIKNFCEYLMHFDKRGVLHLQISIGESKKLLQYSLSSQGNAVSICVISDNP